MLPVELLTAAQGLSTCGEFSMLKTFIGAPAHAGGRSDARKRREQEKRKGQGKRFFIRNYFASARAGVGTNPENPGKSVLSHGPKNCIIVLSHRFPTGQARAVCVPGP